MKRFFVLFILGVVLFPMMSFAQENEYTPEQLALRSDIFNFVKQEGFVPEIDPYGDIKFKSEGDVYYIAVSYQDKSPMYVSFYRYFGSYPAEFSRDVVVMATGNLNLYKGIKIICFEDAYRIGADMYVNSAEPIKDAFYRVKSLIKHVESEFYAECANVGTVGTMGGVTVNEIPFIITKLEVGNTDENQNVIQDFGSTIWDFKTKFLSPRITVKPYTNNGTYKLYVKLYKDGVLKAGSSSPEGYSYTADVTISGRSEQVFTLTGWGSSTAGYWQMGDYRFEIWYGDYCIGSKSFKVN